MKYTFEVKKPAVVHNGRLFLSGYSRSHVTAKSQKPGFNLFFLISCLGNHTFFA